MASLNVTPVLPRAPLDTAEIIREVNAAFLECKGNLLPLGIHRWMEHQGFVPELWNVRGNPAVDSFTERVLARIEKAELKARLGDRDDLRIAWVTVLECSKGHPYPWQQAFWQCLHGLPEKLIPFFEAREYLNQIHENTGAVLDKYLPFRYTPDWQENLVLIKAKLASIAAALPLPPKKPAQSVRFIQKNRNVVG